MALTFDAVRLEVGELLAPSDLARDRANAGNLQSAVCVRVKLRNLYAQLAARVHHPIPQRFDAVDGRLHCLLVQMSPNLVESAQRVSVGVKAGCEKL